MMVQAIPTKPINPSQTGHINLKKCATLCTPHNPFSPSG